MMTNSDLVVLIIWATLEKIRCGFFIPQHDEQTFTTEWRYDTWNRLTGMEYPDGEKVEYGYNVGGLLRSMKGKKKGTEYKYVEQLGYDKFEQRQFLHYGNGTKTTYAYEPERRRPGRAGCTTWWPRRQTGGP
jgi:YD repeat-containing protein